MRNANTVWIALLLAVLVLAAAFLFLDFRAMQSNTRVESQVATTKSGDPALASQPLDLYIQGTASLAVPLQREILDRLLGVPAFGDVRPMDTPAPGSQNPVLVLEIGQADILWTPVYSSAFMNIEVGFASDGAVVWEDLGEVETVFEGGDVLRMSGDFSLSDRSFGMIGRRGYLRYLAEQIAQKVIEALESALQQPTTGM